MSDAAQASWPIRGRSYVVCRARFEIRDSRQETVGGQDTTRHVPAEAARYGPIPVYTYRIKRPPENGLRRGRGRGRGRGASRVGVVEGEQR